MKRFVIFYLIIMLGFTAFFYSRSKPKDRMIHVLNHKTNEVMEMTVEQFTQGAVRGEMPESFELEALKAQAVAARTYLYCKMEKSNHEQADICTNPACCCAFSFVTDNDKIKEAVKETEGEILTYKNKPISAVFHSATGGDRTENSEDVWTNSLPYLKSVETEGENIKKGYETTVSYSHEEFEKILKEKYPEADFTKPLFENMTKTQGGAVANVSIYGVPLRGVNVRSLFGLRSACFEIKEEDKITFTVHGYGHGVGMSQYGANFMASKGKNYKDILHHYYTDVKITKK